MTITARTVLAAIEAIPETPENYTQLRHRHPRRQGTRSTGGRKMSQQPIHLTKRGELVMGILSALVALVIVPAVVTLDLALLMVAP